MFTSLSDIKIHTNDYIEEYKKNFSCLVDQKNKDRSNKINEIMLRVVDEKIFKIDGTNNFKEGVYKNIKTLLEVKPGRLLIKELIKLITIFPEDDYPLTIRSGKIDFHHQLDGIIDINLDEDSSDYNALSRSKEVKSSRPKAIVLAHELIHELHNRENQIETSARVYQQRFPSIPAYLKDVEIYPNPTFNGGTFEGFESSLIFKDLDNLEEEHTILGINIPKFLKKKNLDKLDVLSENVFLCAFNLLPRIDHQAAKNDSIEENHEVNQDCLTSYYQWLSLRLNERNEKIENKLIPDY